MRHRNSAKDWKVCEIRALTNHVHTNTRVQHTPAEVKPYKTVRQISGSFSCVGAGAGGATPRWLGYGRHCHRSGRSASLPITSICKMSSAKVSSGRSGPKSCSASPDAAAFDPALRPREACQQSSCAESKSGAIVHAAESRSTASLAPPSQVLQDSPASSPPLSCRCPRSRLIPARRSASAPATTPRTLHPSDRSGHQWRRQP